MQIDLKLRHEPKQYEYCIYYLNMGEYFVTIKRKMIYFECYF